ncbi:MAG: hypothetical protein AAGH78_17850 [Cyanobacteria bacterium P01_H01_bin.58]
MKIEHPDIVVVSPDGEYLIIVDVKFSDSPPLRQRAMQQLKHLMVSMGCSVGLAITGNHIFLLRDSLEKSNGESITVVGEAMLPEHLLPSADEQWQGKRGLEFESRVQRWLEKLKQTPNRENLPNDLGELLGEPIMSLIKLGDIRSAGPRWGKVAS